MIRNNAHKYSVSTMCKVLNISRSTYYYEAAEKPDESALVERVREIFRLSRDNYGTRKIKKELAKEDLVVSRRRIGRIMNQEGLVSSYAVAQFKPHVDKPNESKITNVVNREFNEQPQYNVVVSDLIYVRVGMIWNYICVLVDLFNREITGFSAGRNKDTQLVAQAFTRVETFNIERSLSMKGCPYDNAVAEATYKIIKTEFIKKRVFDSLEELQIELADYVNWFNNHRRGCN